MPFTAKGLFGVNAVATNHDFLLKLKMDLDLKVM
ncbi:MAG: hypothetical protein BWX58_00904 [Deltaproteobacteria bacterium ADurb.Bin026]|nr:MAG: hypothetical protein BWX58_00904 [Deltaproteobacteria bacterium ADurb.Bin026]